MAKKKKARKSSNKIQYGNGGQILGNSLRLLGDTALSTVGMSDVINDNSYKGKSAQDFTNISNVVSPIAQTVGTIALNSVAPGAGTITNTLGSTINSKLNYQEGGDLLPSDSLQRAPVLSQITNKPFNWREPSIGLGSLSQSGVTDTIKIDPTKLSQQEKLDFIYNKKVPASYIPKTPGYYDVNGTIMKFQYGGHITDSASSNYINRLCAGGKMKYEEGGQMLTEYSGMPHEMGGIPLGQTNNEVEDKETRFEDYIFSDTIKLPKRKSTFAQESKRIKNKYKLRVNDKYDQEQLKLELTKLQQSQEAEKALIDSKEIDTMEPMMETYRSGGSLNFKSGAAYNKWLAYGHAYGEFAKTPGHQKVSIKGKGVNVKHAQGGYLNKYEGGGTIDRATYQSKLGELNKQMQAGTLDEIGYNDAVRALGYELEGIPQASGSIAPVQSKGLPQTPSMSYPDVSGANHPYQLAQLANAANQGTIEEQQAGEQAYQDYLNSSGYKNDMATGEPLDNTTTTNGTSPSTKSIGTGDQSGTGQGMFNQGLSTGEQIASYLPAAVQAINLIGGPEKTKFERYKPQYINLEEQRQGIRRQGAQSQAVGQQNIRNVASSPGSYLSNMVAQNVGLNKNLSEGLSNSYLSESTTNTQIGNQAGQMNTGISNQETIANEQNRAAFERAALDTTISGTMAYKGNERDKRLFSSDNLKNNVYFSTLQDYYPNYGYQPRYDKNGNLIGLPINYRD